MKTDPLSTTPEHHPSAPKDIDRYALRQFGTAFLGIKGYAKFLAFGLIWLITDSSSEGQVYEKLIDFVGSGKDDPQHSVHAFNLVQGDDGDFYGASRFGGFHGAGTIFKMTASGNISSLVEFEFGTPNLWPSAALVKGVDGNFYGTSAAEGRSAGAIFRVTPQGAVTNLVEFDWDDPIKGYHPASTMVQGFDGSFYGLTRNGGAYGRGTIFRMTPFGNLTTLVHFNGPNGSLSGFAHHDPDVSLAVGDDGNLYGVTPRGGLHELGTVFKMAQSGELTNLVHFTGSGGTHKGANPNALFFGSDGALFGTTLNGGTSGGGTIFRVTTEGVLATISEFAWQTGAASPNSLIQASDGNFYGTSYSGGGGYSDYGTVFRATPEGDLSVLVHFTGGEGPNRGGAPSSLMQGSDGYLYGTTFEYDFETGIPSVIFKMSLSGQIEILSELTPDESNVGWTSESSLAEGPDGELHGVTYYGGLGVNDFPYSGRGTAFSVSPEGSLSTLHRFESKRPSSLVAGSDGNFYGTTHVSLDDGSIFRLSPSGDFTQLVEFSGNEPTNKGSRPHALLLGEDGNFYGATLNGGAMNLGTVFRMTPTGQLTTLVEFGDDETNHGLRRPFSSLVRGNDGSFYGTTAGQNFSGSIFKVTPEGALTNLAQLDERSNQLALGIDGNFYGTTQYGGAYGLGTVFRMTPSGSVTTLVEFTGNALVDKGIGPRAGLEIGSDGNFYGTTSEGGMYDHGTVFKMTPSGDLTTIWEFESASDGFPLARLVAASDGNLYGTTFGPSGIVYRIILPGMPMIGRYRVAQKLDGAVHVESLINPRGSRTEVYVEFGPDGGDFPFSNPVTLNLTGYQHQLIGTKLTGLPPGETIHYRFRAVSSAGTSLGRVATFSTIAEPLASIGPATDLLSSSVRFNGSVNPRNYNATARFEWGEDGNSFPNSVAISTGAIDGNTPAPVSAPVAGLTKGTTYHYRLVATNAGGTAVSGTQSFRTLTDPVPAVGGSFALSTTSARVEGAVDPEDSDTSVVFEYGTDGVTFPNSVSATQGLQSGNGIRAVSAVLTNLSQGVTYHYRLRATSAGGTGVSESASFSMNVLSGFSRVHPGPPPESQGFLLVNLSPPGLAHGWRFLGERQWRASGVPVGGLVSGDRVVEFRPLAGHVAPPAETVSVTSGAAAAVLDRLYFETEARPVGGLAVVLKPDSIAEGPGRARWRLLGEGEGDWRDSGEALAGLPPGPYVIECKPVAGRATPPNASVAVVEGQTAAPTLTYFEAGSFAGIEPAPLAFETAVQEPYAHLGQLRSALGSGTGFVVKQRVVATAAHVVWDEGENAAAKGLEWHFQRHSGLHEPRPQEPRGFYLLSGYAALREAEGTPGSFSPASRHLDVAALYLNTAAGRGGFGGFLASDLGANEFLLSSADKMLVGYPLDGIAAGSQGRMHATSPFDVAFSPVGPAAPRVFLTTAIRSSGGASGGPLLVQFEGGPYYPAAIYLGGVEQTLVRAIDGAVVDLFDRAELSSIDGEPHVSGGVTHTSVQSLGGPGDPGALAVTIQPAGARNAGAGWRLRPEGSWRGSGTQRLGLAPGRYVLELRAVAGYEAPAPQSVQIAGGQLLTLTYTYATPSATAPSAALRGNGRDIANGSGTPSALDGTDFGVVVLGGGTQARSFTVANTGGSALSLGTPGLSGPHADDFSLTVPPGASVPAGGSTAFTLLFAPSAAGTRTATVSFATNAPGANPFTFAIQGNDETDSNSNGFSDVEEAAIDGLLTSFTVGQTVDLDLSFLRLGEGLSAALTGLPPGLSFDPATMRVTGTVAGKPDAFGHELRKMDGGTVAASYGFDLTVLLPGALELTRARRFATTRLGRRSRPQAVGVANSGETPLLRIAARATGPAARDYLVKRPARSLDPGAGTQARVVFRPRARGTRKASLRVTSSAAPRSVPLRGRGR